MESSPAGLKGQENDIIAHVIDLNAILASTIKIDLFTNAFHACMMVYRF